MKKFLLPLVLVSLLFLAMLVAGFNSIEDNQAQKTTDIQENAINTLNENPLGIWEDYWNKRTASVY